MDIRKLTDDFSVAPQLTPDEMPAVAAAGFRTVICNRPDTEIGPDLCCEEMRVAAEAAGLVWFDNPIQAGGMTMENVDDQGKISTHGQKPVLAYCRSGTRSATAWAFAQAGELGVDEVISAAANGGYDLSPYRAQLVALADSK